ncbi:MAG TPA: SBBP repeat-containing protein [Thermoanaerobaculia bacterium]
MRAGLLTVATLIAASSALAGTIRTPILFEENRGQAAPSARFLARAGASTLFLADDSAEMRLAAGSDSPPDVLTMKLRGAMASAPRGEQRKSVAVHYFVGRGRNEWQTGIPVFGAVRYPNVYPKVDLLYHASGGALEYDFEVRPGGNPRAIRVAFEGARSVSLSERGELVVATGHATVHQPRPVAFQVVQGRRRPVAVDYALANGNEVEFRIGRYDRRRPLVIDPVIRYSTYLGGDGEDLALAVATDGGGNTYVAGCTQSTNFPHAPGPASGKDAYVTKIDATGSAIVYTAILGGVFDDCAGGIAVAADGSASVTGYTRSEDFPIRNALQSAYGGSVDAFVSALAPDGTLRYSSYLGGDDGENVPELGRGGAIAIDAEGAAYVTGHTGSFNFPVTAGAVQTTLASSIDAFVAKVDTTREGAESLLYATYLGGTSFDAASAIGVDRAGSAYVTGNTRSPDFPATPHALQRSYAGNRFGDAFLAKLDPAGASLSYATYLGGSEWDTGEAVAVDDSGHAYVVATTMSIDFPTVQPLQTAGGGFFKSDDRGERWRKSNTGLRTSLIRALAADPAHPGRLYAGSDRGMYRSDDFGESWSESNSGLPLDASGELDVGDVVVDANGRIFAGTEDGLYRSDDGGTSWVATGGGLPLSALGTIAVGGLALDPQGTTLYVQLTSLGNNVHRSADAGRTWEAIDDSAPEGRLTVFNGALEVDPHRGSIYAGSFGQIFRSDDGGATWQSLTNGLPYLPIYAIAFHPHDPNVIHAASITAVFTSTDRGATWTRTSDGLGDLIITDLLVDPDEPSTLYAIGEANGVARVAATAGGVPRADADADPVNGGVFKSTDGGRHWRPANAGLESNGWGTLATPGGGVIWAGAAVRADVAVTKLSPDGSRALFSTYVSGRDHDFPAGAVIRCGNRLVVAGSTVSNDYPLRAPIQSERRGHLFPDAFLTELSLSGDAILFSTFAGSPDEEESTRGVAADCAGNIYLAGHTYARQFPLVSPLQPGHAGGGLDAFVMKVNVEQEGRRRAVRH